MSVIDQNDAQALTDFASDSALARLEDLVNEFNLFDAVGLTNQEIRHSAFLSYLLNPKQTHGLGDHFLKIVISLGHTASADVWPDNINNLDLSDAHVEREWNHIDILIRSHRHRLAIVIENKVWAGEQEGQLKRYQDTVKACWSNWHVVCLYLTPHGHSPSEPQYVPITYRALVEEIEKLLRDNRRSLNGEFSTLLRHYAQMMRRQIVGNSDIAKQCAEIYHKHKRAIDLIIANRPDHQKAIRELMERLVLETDGLKLDTAPSGGLFHVSFLPSSWDAFLPKGAPNDFSKENRILFFAFYNFPKELYICLTIRPGNEVDREHLVCIAQKYPHLLREFRTNGGKYIQLYRRDLLTADSYDVANSEILLEELKHQWEDFVSTDLPAIEAIFCTEFGLSQPQ